MKQSMTSPDIYSWLIKNRSYILGSYIKKVNTLNDGKIILKLHKKDEGNRDLVLDPSGWIYFNNIEGELSNIAKFLRDELENLRIDNIEQLNFDRIIKIDFPFNKSIILEMFSGGNVILLNNNIINFALKYKEWKSKEKARSIKKGEFYKAPPPPINPFSITIEEFQNILKTDEQVVKLLALKLNLSHYAELICNLSGIEKSTMAKNIQDDKIKILYENIKNFLNSIDGSGYLCEGQLSCVKFEGCEFFENINDAIIKVLSTEIKEESEDERILKEQMKTLEEYQKLMEEYKKFGDEILMNLDTYNQIVQKVRKRETVPEVISIDGTNVTIKLNENSPEIKFDITKKATEMAQYYYENSKKLSKKIEGIKEIMGKRKIKENRKKEIKETLNRKRFWFEKYRWFISSENAIVIAGRDAKTNEEVVKKYLGEKDIYVHADIHGAPSVVVKNNNITEKTLVEAGIFGLSYSKAWNAGYNAGDAYWVTYSQVSKMAESGEYVAKGAWVIRGKRNYMRNLPLRIAMGFITYENTKILMAGPVDAVSSKTSDYVVLIPSEKSKTDLAKILSERFKYPVDEIMKLLPPGPGEIVEDKHDGESSH